MNVKKQLENNAALVEMALKGAVTADDPDFLPVLEAQIYSLLAPRAKRIRPTLVLEFCRMLGGKDEAALPLAVAVEMLHTYSLIHDDLPCMDDDDLRRGRPTCHKTFGEAFALLAGDALLTGAFEKIATAPCLSATAARDAVRVLAAAAGDHGMIGGQVIDLLGEKEQLPEEVLLKLHRHKTGALIRASAILGVIAAGYSPDDREARDAACYAEGIGLAFQIVDDVLDVTESADVTGKSVGSDQKQQKTTFMTYYEPKEALAYAKRVSDGAKAAIGGYAASEFLLALADHLINRRY